MSDKVINPDGVDWRGPPDDTRNDDELVLVPEGEYEMTYVRHCINNIFKRWYCVIVFQITTFGEHFGKQLPRYYNCRRIGPRSVTAGPKSDLYREFYVAANRRPQKRRIPISEFKDRRLIGRVQTVRSDRDQDTLPDALRYSKVAKILRRAD